jgi:inorganic pyrophosphatase
MKFYLTVFLTSFCFNFLIAQNETTHTVISTNDFLRDFPAVTENGFVNIIVEIPAGCNQKWEVNKTTGFLEWEQRGKDSLRVIEYLPYPANYGMIPQTYLSVEEGGDGDPLDVFLLGKSVERGTVIEGRIIGVIKMLDRNEQDDKLLAVSEQDWFGRLNSLADLENSYKGVTEILTTWLTHYKGVDGIIEIQYIGDEQEAMKILEQAIISYQNVNGVID